MNIARQALASDLIIGGVSFITAPRPPSLAECRLACDSIIYYRDRGETIGMSHPSPCPHEHGLPSRRRRLVISSSNQPITHRLKVNHDSVHTSSELDSLKFNTTRITRSEMN
ncbi:hypothetical protein JTE90_003671 [Oedothorax gibbosus]|uniref:Uncharacterized protein n=1 Tax=Oedothorax gibbosus TaxID=931172 RepID=A0AAV6VRD1_9ARAC|nr:hypothetical protein JTE90_003671 [Oedothorax gibbosus]